jgi:hypothetical protein
MKRLALAITCLGLLGLASAGAAQANGGWRGHGHGHGHYFRPYVVVGAPAFWWGRPFGWGLPYPIWYAPPVYGYAPPVYGYGPPQAAVVVPAPAPTVYIERSASAPPAAGWWYFCESAGRYYPNVESCPEGWVKVPPRPE